jgi:starch synthase
MKILFVASEGLPYSKTGGLADVIGGLPKALRELKHEVVVLLPRYRGTKMQSTLISSLTLPVGDRLRFPAIGEDVPLDGVRYLFVDDDEYFDRPGIYGDKTGDYADNAERYAEFSRVAIEVAKRIWLPDVIHCHDWQTALVPVLLRTQHALDPTVRSIPVVLTIHNLAYQGVFPRAALRKIGIPDNLFSIDGMEFYGKVNFLKGGLLYADYLTTVSRRYAKEIQTAEYGCGLEGVISRRADRLVGILNGVDYGAWNPETDKLIGHHYSVTELEGKQGCKTDLLAEMKLGAENLDRPLIGIVSRFVDQKGFDLISDIATEILAEDVALVALGTGEVKYEHLFKDLAAKYPERVSARIGYDEALAHKIEAGADMFLMPSRFEPCGLNQIYSLKYGTPPIVRATGGLDDTVQNYSSRSANGTGFKFEAYEPQDLLAAIRAALKTYRDQKAWRGLQANGMAKDFSWRSSAEAYVTLYERAKRSRIPRVARTSKV